MNYDLNFLVWVASSSSYLTEFLERGGDSREEVHLGNRDDSKLAIRPRRRNCSRLA